MTEENEELSADELDALLKDLEGRAAGSGSSGKKAEKKSSSVEDEEPEDVEAFLRQLEEDASAETTPAPTRTRNDDLADEFASLESAPEADLEKVSSKEEKSKKKQEKLSDKDVKVVERGESRGLAIAGAVARWSLVLVPALAAWWLVGAYLSQWVSAGWLVFAVATTLILGVPGLLKSRVKRGRYVYWFAGFSLLTGVGLSAPIPHLATDALAKYGHWPASTVAEIADLAPDSFVVSANAWAGHAVAGLLNQTADPLPDARRLGRDVSLEAAPGAQPEDVKEEKTTAPESGADETDRAVDSKADSMESAPDEATESSGEQPAAGEKAGAPKPETDAQPKGAADEIAGDFPEKKAAPDKPEPGADDAPEKKAAPDKPEPAPSDGPAPADG